jgi:hypothetical protein
METTEYDGDVEKSLADDTMLLFESDDYEIKDLAANNMNWVDVQADAVLLEDGDCDFQEGWVNGDKSVIDCPFSYQLGEEPPEIQHKIIGACVSCGEAAYTQSPLNEAHVMCW